MGPWAREGALGGQQRHKAHVKCGHDTPVRLLRQDRRARGHQRLARECWVWARERGATSVPFGKCDAFLK